jgi:hypothetical protein
MDLVAPLRRLRRAIGDVLHRRVLCGACAHDQHAGCIDLALKEVEGWQPMAPFGACDCPSKECHP